MKYIKLKTSIHPAWPQISQLENQQGKEATRVTKMPNRKPHQMWKSKDVKTDNCLSLTTLLALLGTNIFSLSKTVSSRWFLLFSKGWDKDPFFGERSCSWLKSSDFQAFQRYYFRCHWQSYAIRNTWFTYKIGLLQLVTANWYNLSWLVLNPHLVAHLLVI